MKKSGAINIFLYLLMVSTIICAQNAPVSTLSSYSGTDTYITLPVTVADFNNIGSCNLKLIYDPSIAIAMDVTSGPQLGGQLAVNVSEPGIISLGWYTYPGLTLPDNTVIFNIEFAQVAIGFTEVTFEDDGYSCSWTDETFNYLNDQPTSSYYINGSIDFQMEVAPHTILPEITTCDSTDIDLPVKVTGFNNIGAVSLDLLYDPEALSYQSFTNDAGFPGLIVNETSPGELIIAGFTTLPDGYTIDDSLIFFTLHFENLGNSTALSWYDDGESCEYAGPTPDYAVLNDLPHALFYYNGSFTKLTIPEPAGTISGPDGGEVCKGQSGVTFSIDPIVNATNYQWLLPDGTSIIGTPNSDTIIVSFNQNAVDGEIVVFGYNQCGNGIASQGFPIVVNSPPNIIEQPVSPDSIIAGAGIAALIVQAEGSNLIYQWQEYINDWSDISNGGVYEGANTDSLIISNPPISMNGLRYRCIVSGFCDPVAITDGLAELTVVTFTNINNWNPNLKVSEDEIKLETLQNPFKNQLQLKYYLQKKGVIQVKIFNLLGNNVFTSKICEKDKGNYELNIDTSHLNSGLFTVMLIEKTKSELLIKSIKVISNNH